MSGSNKGLDKVGKIAGYRPPRSMEQRELDKAEMAHLLRRGWTRTMVAERFQLSRETVDKDWRDIVEELHTDRDEDIRNLIAEKLVQYAEVKREAWDAWERSKEVNRKLTVEDTFDDNGIDQGKSRNRKTRTSRAQVGDPRFLEKVLHCLEAERELLNLDPVKKVQVEGTIVNWDILIAPLPEGPLPDDIEVELVKASLEHQTKLAALQSYDQTDSDSSDSNIDQPKPSIKATNIGPRLRRPRGKSGYPGSTSRSPDPEHTLPQDYEDGEGY